MSADRSDSTPAQRSAQRVSKALVTLVLRNPVTASTYPPIFIKHAVA